MSSIILGIAALVAINSFNYNLQADIDNQAAGLLGADLVITGKTLAIAVAKGKYFGSGLCIAPHALLSDGEFGVTHVGNVSMFDFLMHLGSLKKGKKINHPEAQYFKAKNIKVTSDDKTSAVEADGEFIGYLPLKINILPQQISFLHHQK